MRTMSTTLKVLTCTAFILAITSLAQAQATRTWVSGVGDDVNPCSRTAPCKTFAGAISKTAANGEIDCIDPGGFGTVTINKSITIDGGGTFASILNSGTNGVNVNDSATATPGTIQVILRNLSINGTGTTLGVNGVNFVSGKSLMVEGCRIEKQNNNGINISTAQVITVMVEDTIISNCNGSGFFSNDGSAQSTLFRSVLKNNSAGITDQAGVVNVSHCDVSHNTNGIRATTGASLMHIDNSTINSNGGNGVEADAGSVVRLSNNDVWRNGTGLNNAGTMETYRNNRVRGSTVSNLTGVLTDVSAINTGTF